MTYNKLPECVGCTLINEPGIVWGSGDPATAKIIYIAQNPAQHEVDARPMQPLIGPSGNVFNRQLYEAGVRRDELFVTNQVKCKTPNNREPTPLEVSKCRHLLAKELARAKADTVVLAGALAFKENIGTYSTIHQHYHPPDNVMARMGCVEQKDGRKWIGTIHPAFVMRMQDFKDEATGHLRKAREIAGVKIPIPEVIIDPTPNDIKEHHDRAITNGSFADDTESFEMPYDVEEDDYVGGMWRPDLCGFSAIPYRAFVVPFDRTAEVWSDIFSRPEIVQFEHNGEHDRYDLERVAFQGNKRFDTMIAHHWLNNNVYKYLKPQCIRLYTNLPYYDRSLEKVNRRLYCGMDNITTLLAGREQTRQLKKILIPPEYRWNNIETLYDLINELGFPPLPILEEQRRIGARCNVRKAFLYQKITLKQVEQAEALIAQMLGPFFNWKSPKQKRELWYDIWKLPPQYNIDKKTREKKLTTDDDARVALRRWIAQSQERMTQFNKARIFFDLLDLATEKKNLAGYFDRVSPDERVHAHWKPHTETYRLSSVPNFQNWPTWRICCGKEVCTCGSNLDSVRSIIIPDHEEDVLVSTDFDQIELWGYAVQYNIKWLLEVYEKGDYIYGMVSEDVLGVPFFEPGKPRTKKYKMSAVPDPWVLRCKAIPLGFQNGRSGESVAAEHNWPIKEGIELRNAWFRRCPEYPKAHADINYKMKQQGILRPPPGVILHYPVPNMQGLAVPGQTPSAFMLYKCMVDCDREFKRREWETRIVLSVHDSLLFNIRNGKAHPKYVKEAYREVIEPILRQPVPWLGGFRYRHAAKIGQMWDWGMESYDAWEMVQETSNRSLT
jgi:uracil-DNA glycosylase family 4